MAKVECVIRTATTFAADGEFDDEAMGGWLQRFVDADMTLYVASSGSGEGSALTIDELRRLYRVAVATAAGHVTVGANLPDQHTAALTLEHARLAIECGVDEVQLYGPARAHGYLANDAEYRAYFDTLLGEISSPVTLSPNPIVGFTPSAATLADIANAHSQVVGIGLTGIHTDIYYIELRDRLNRDLRISVNVPGSLNSLTMGATGLNVELANLVPKTSREYADLFSAGRFDEIGAVYAHLQRVADFTAYWKSTSPRTHKMGMRAFRLPGWKGGVRPPFQDLDDTELQTFTTGLLALGVPEIDEMARVAGLATA